MVGDGGYKIALGYWLWCGDGPFCVGQLDKVGGDRIEVVDTTLDGNIGCGESRDHFALANNTWLEVMGLKVWIQNMMAILVVVWVRAILGGQYDMAGGAGTEVVDTKPNGNIGRGVGRGHFASPNKIWLEVIQLRL